ncbi:MAG: hypothetical protein AAB510_02470 [Patescibacteria group bacterium]
MKKVVVIDKKEGETPLAALDNFRLKNKGYEKIKMTYAGRLDPMARGLLLVLTGEEVKNKDKYLALTKEYVFEVLFGFSTDTYDILGKVTSPPVFRYIKSYNRKNLSNSIKDNLKYFKGGFIQTYPAYSSKTVDGKALFVYAREGLDVPVTTREVNVKNLEFLSLRKISGKKLLSNIEKRIAKVEGDFRQQIILNMWDEKLNTKIDKVDQEFFIAKFVTTCSSGTYVRAIANALGEKMCVPALAYMIKRTKIGRYGKI